jgi:signal transduction histidine kinase
VSHELRTPLTAIVGFAELLKLKGLEGSVGDSIDRIDAAAHHLLDLVEELLDVARIEAGALTLETEEVPVSAAVEDVLALAAPLAAKKGVQLRSRGSSGTAVVADPRRFAQVLINLVTNAIKFNSRGGAVEVSWETTRDGVRVAVRDTGPGIAPEDLPRLFRPYERLSRGRTPEPGTGLGLAVARLLTEAMDGTIDVDTAPGRGTTFCVVLPAAEVLATAAQG